MYLHHRVRSSRRTPCRSICRTAARLGMRICEASMSPAWMGASTAPRMSDVAATVQISSAPCRKPSELGARQSGQTVGTKGIVMSRDIIITCAVTGAGDTVGKHPAIPVTPEQIATSALDAAGAGAAIVHIHVRDPETGKPSRELTYYREVVERIRRSGVDVIINLTGGPGANYFPSAENPAVGGPGTTLSHPEDRFFYIKQRPPKTTLFPYTT